MNRFIVRGTVGILLVLMALLPMGPVAGQPPSLDPACGIMAFSTEEDFVTQAPEPPDGNPIISDGDLLALATDPAGNVSCIVCARNAGLLQNFDLAADLGLDAVDVISTTTALVAFSTELNGPNFTQGDLLATNGAVIPNRALTFAYGQGAVNYDAGLDALQFVGDPEAISAFLSYLKESPLSDPSLLSPLLEEYGLDILFSTEAGWSVTGAAAFLDGDLLSARDGIIVAGNWQLLPASVPAGLPSRGVDFGLDAATTDRTGSRPQIHFSTEILYEGDPPFTDGDILLAANGLVLNNKDLVGCFEPRAEFLGLDALHMALEPAAGDIQGRKWHDLDADGVADVGEPGLGQWQIKLSGLDEEGNPVEEVAWTDATGVYTFTVTPGTYTVAEVCPAVAAWYQSHPLPTAGECGTGVYNIDVVAGDPPHTGLDFGNYQHVTKSGYKFNDTRPNGIWEDGELPLPEWEIHLDGSDGLGNTVQVVAYTNANGYYSFSVPPGTYTVSEVCPASGGWSQTLPDPTNGCGTGVYTFNPASGDAPHEGNNFGNYQAGMRYLPVILRQYP